MPRVLLLALASAALVAGCVAQPDESRQGVPSPALPDCASVFVNAQWEDAQAATAENLSAAFEEAGFTWNATQSGVAEVRASQANVTTRLALPSNETTESAVLTLTVRGAAGDASEERVLAEASRIAEVVNQTAPDARLQQWLVDATDAGCGAAGAGERDAGFDATSDR